MKIAIIVFALFPFICNAQYLIEGKVDTSLQFIRVELDILDEWNQFSSVSDEMVIKSTVIDQGGNFRFTGNELSDKAGFCRWPKLCNH